MMFPPLSVDAIVVSYNTRDLLLDCLAALETVRAAGELERIIVVDSSSPDGSAETARIAYPKVDLIEVPNGGYGAAANAGMLRSNADAMLVLNADTVVPSGAALTLSAALAHDACIAVAGPRLRYPDGRLQPSRRRFPQRWTPIFESTVLQDWFPNNRWVRDYYVADRPEDVQQDVDWLYGAALMVRRAACEEVGGFDEQLRMYCEETEWCWRLRQAGWTVRYVPEAEITHHEGASSAADSPTRQINFDYSRVEFQRRLFGPRVAELVRTALLAGYIMRIARDAPKWLVGHKRPLRARRMRMYVEVLRNGLLRRPEPQP
jgi:hypothetical protein